MKNEVRSLLIKKGALGKVTAIGTHEDRRLYIDNKQRSMRVYPMTSEGVITATVYTPTTRGETNIKMGDELVLENPRMFSIISRIGRNQFYDNVIIADSVKKGSGNSPLKGSTLKEKLVELKFHKGYVKDFIDFDQTFGDLIYMAHSPVYYYDEEERVFTDKVISHEMIVISDITGKTYGVEFEDPNTDLSSLDKSIPMQEIIKLKSPELQLYIDSRQTNQGTTIKIKATGIIIPTASTPTPIPTPDVNKSPKQNDEKTNNNENKNNKQGQQS